MVLSKDLIIDWYNQYNNDPDNDNELEGKVLRSIDTIKTWENFKDCLLHSEDGILKWKIALRTKHYYDSMDSGKWIALFDIVKDSLNQPKETVKKIVAFSSENMRYRTKSGHIRKGGINYRVASTLVYFFSKGKCPIIDWRTILTLKNNEYSEQLKKVNLYYNKKNKTWQTSLGNEGWNDYYDLCHKIVSEMKIESIENDMPIRVLDKALWKFPDLSKTK